MNTSSIRLYDIAHGTSPKQLRSRGHVRLSFTLAEEAHPMRVFSHSLAGLSATALPDWWP